MFFIMSHNKKEKFVKQKLPWSFSVSITIDLNFIQIGPAI